MIMKLNVSNELKSRLMHAAANGSVIAADILSELKKNRPAQEIIRGSYNFLSTKRKWTDCGSFRKIRIVFTAFNKDPEHPNFPDRNNPQAPWFPENRTDLEPSTFVELFKNLPKYSPYEINYFCSALSLDSKVTVRLHESMNDFMEAYLESNYSPISDSDTSSLHSSCMRYEDKARNAADFYTNFAGAKILVARDESNNILGRAVVWNEVTLWKSINTPIAASLLDRIYSSHAFVAELIRKQAQEAGILLRRRYNDYTHTTDFTVLNPIEGQEWAAGDNIQVSLTVKVPACRWHKKGVPYLDTFYSLHLTDGNLELRNTEGDTSIATCRSTEGRANRRKYVCPKCGKLLSGYGILQELSGHVLYIHRIRKSTERHVRGIQGKEISVLPLQEGTSRTGVQTVPANRKVVHLLKSQYHGKINGSLQHLLPLRQGGEDGRVHHRGTQADGYSFPARPARKHLRGQRQPEKLPLCRGAHGRGTPAQDRHLCSPSCGGLDDCRL